MNWIRFCLEAFSVHFMKGHIILLSIQKAVFNEPAADEYFAYTDCLLAFLPCFLSGLQNISYLSLQVWKVSISEYF